MAKPHARCRPAIEALEGRLALSAAQAAAVPAITPAETLIILNQFVKSYLSTVGQPNYNPAFDFNHNGQIGQTDAKILLHALPPVSRKIPLKLTLTLAPQDRAPEPLPQNSGGVTHDKEPTVLGHTTPGALVFSGTGTYDLNLHGPAVVADANGNFAYKITLTDGINQLDFQVVTPFGQQLLRAFPIYWLNFAQYEAAHPRKD
jgi:hypothetical protein